MASTTAPSIEDWKCPVCLEMVCKPVVGSCGHVFCFWCEHKSMDVFDKSACPTCRRPFNNLPAVCDDLHAYLGRTYPKEYAQRLREQYEEEKKDGNFSPNDGQSELFGVGWTLELCNKRDMKTMRLISQGNGPEVFDLLEKQEPETSGDSDFKTRFTCDFVKHDMGIHHHCLWEPCVLTCGHTVCKHCATSHLTFGAGSTSVCPHPECCMRIVGDEMPDVCKLMQTVIEASPLAEEARSAAAAREEAATRGEKPHRYTFDPRMLQGSEDEEEALEVEYGSEDSEEEHEEEEEEHEEEEEEEEDALPGAVPEGIDPNTIPRPDPDTFVHVAVGCDACGVYPIRGRRFRCVDCPERMGFDLCGACHGMVQSRFDHDERHNDFIAGRFNQRHRPGHRMKEVVPVPDFFHILQQRHPDLNPRQILDFLQEHTRMDHEGNEDPITNAADNIVAEILDGIGAGGDAGNEVLEAMEEGGAGGSVMEGGHVEAVVRADADAEALLTRQLFEDEEDDPIGGGVVTRSRSSGARQSGPDEA